MPVFHWWFIAVPEWIWHHITPLGFGTAVAGVLLYALYALANALVLLAVLAAIRVFAKGVKKGLKS